MNYNKNFVAAIACAMGVSAAFLPNAAVTEAAEVITSTITGNLSLADVDKIDIETYHYGLDGKVAILAYNNSYTLTIDKNLPITVNNTDAESANGAYARGIAVYSSKLQLDGNGKLVMNVVSNEHASGIDNDAGTFICNPDLDITVRKAEGYVGSSTSATGNEAAYGIESRGDNNAPRAYNTFNGNVKLDVAAEHPNFAVCAATLYDSDTTFNKSVDFKAVNNDTGDYGYAYAVYNYSYSNLYMKGDAAISAQSANGNSAALYNVFSSTISINKTENSTAEADAVKVNIDGRIYNALSSQTFINAAQGSVINGEIVDNTGMDLSGKDIYGNDYKASATTLVLHNGAIWKNINGSSINTLIMDKGELEQDSDKDVNIKNYSGDGQLHFNVDSVDDNGVIVINGGNVKIDNASEGSTLDADVVNSDKLNTLNKQKLEENLNKIANKIYYNKNDGNLDGKISLDEGLITPEASADIKFDKETNQGYVTVIDSHSKKTATMDGMRSADMAAAIAWREEDSTLTKRLGELRDSKQDDGLWVRMNRGKYEYAGDLHGYSNLFQMGYDKQFGDWHYGAAVSRSRGKASYSNGNGDHNSTALTLYGTWLGDKGHYADIVLKEGRLSTDYDIYAAAGHTHGSYKNWGTAISGEYGRKIKLDGFYLTPQAQLTYTRIGGDSYTTSNGISVNQDSYTSLLGRASLELGKYLADKGQAYVRASLLHEFDGEGAAHLRLNGIDNSYDYATGNTWYELAVGFNYQTAANSYLYVDAAKSFGDDYRMPWRYNVGLRFTF